MMAFRIIPHEYCSVSYANIEDAIRFIKTAGHGCFLAKTDIQSVFRIILINTKDFHLLGMKWENLYYYDRHRLRIEFILHLLDDFRIIAPSYEACSQYLALFLRLCSYLGVPMAPDKTVGPSTNLSFVGIELDSLSMEAGLPHDKIHKYTALIWQFLRRKKVPLQTDSGPWLFSCQNRYTKCVSHNTDQH